MPNKEIDTFLNDVNDESTGEKNDFSNSAVDNIVRESLKKFSNYCKCNIRNVVLTTVAVVAIGSIFGFIADTAWANMQLENKISTLAEQSSEKESSLNQLLTKYEELERQLNTLQSENSSIETSNSKTQEELNQYKLQEEQLYKELESLEKYINDNYTPKISNSTVSRGATGGTLATDPLLDRAYTLYSNVVKYKGANGHTEDLRIAIDAANVEYKMYMNKLPDSRPIRNVRITSGFGYRRDPFTGRSAFHNGIDLGAPNGTSIYSAGAGEVTYSGYHSGGYGNLVIISHGNGIETYYAHCSKLEVKKGDIVGKSDKIAAVGSTGRSTGPHLHFGVAERGNFVDPAKYVKF